MDITINTCFLPHDDPDASLAFYRDVLGFEVRNDVGQGKMRWITVGPAGQPGTSILLAPPATDPGVTEDERRTIAEMMAKGTYGIITMATKDLDGTFERLQASDAEVTTAQQRHRALDPPRHQVAVGGFAVGELELAAEVPGGHVHAAGERLDVQWLVVLPVHPVADAA